MILFACFFCLFNFLVINIFLFLALLTRPLYIYIYIHIYLLFILLMVLGAWRLKRRCFEGEIFLVG